MEEIWKPIIGYEGIYEISNLGRVKSLFFNKEKILKNMIDKNSATYFRCRINLRKNNKQKAAKVHRLVARAFIPNPENKPCVNHIDNDPLNNNAENLEWCTQKENMQHAVHCNRMAHGIKHYSSKLDDKKIIEIRGSKLKQYELAEKYNVKLKTINKIICRKTWKHV